MMGGWLLELDPRGGHHHSWKNAYPYGQAVTNPILLVAESVAPFMNHGKEQIDTAGWIADFQA